MSPLATLRGSRPYSDTAGGFSAGLGPITVILPASTAVCGISWVTEAGRPYALGMTTTRRQPGKFTVRQDVSIEFAVRIYKDCGRFYVHAVYQTRECEPLGEGRTLLAAIRNARATRVG